MLRDQLNQHVFPAHRLDRKTGGVLLFALSKEVEKQLQQQFYENRVDKKYLAIVRGHTAFHRDIRHFAYPFGDRAAWRRQHVAMAEEAGFTSAASAIPGVVETEGRTNLYALPRISWDGRQHSLRAMRVILSGITFPHVKPTRGSNSGF